MVVTTDTVTQVEVLQSLQNASWYLVECIACGTEQEVNTAKEELLRLMVEVTDLLEQKSVT